MSSIRVLHVIGCMNRAGAETMIMNIYRNIDRNRVQFDFMVHTNDKCIYDDEIKKLGGAIYRIPRYTVKNHFQYSARWKQHFKAHPEHTIVHGHIYSTASIYLSIAKKYGCTAIAHSHNAVPWKRLGLQGVVKNALHYPVRHIADILFACSELAGKLRFGRKSFLNGRITVLKNAIDADNFAYNEDICAKKRDELDINNQFIVGHIGRFDTQKNHAFLIDIFAEVKKLHPETVLLLVGDGPLRNGIEEKALRLGLSDSVIFTGVRSDIPDLLQAMDLFLFPSLYEGLGIVIIEAQAAGLPCVISDTITSEAKITDLVEQIPLSEPAEKWAEIVMSKRDYERKNHAEEVQKAGFDAAEVAKWLTGFYEGIK